MFKIFYILHKNDLFSNFLFGFLSKIINQIKKREKQKKNPA